MDRKVRGSSRVRLIKQCLNQLAGQVARCVPVKVNVERRRGTASLGIFTHHADFRDVKDVERGQNHDEVVSRLVVECGHRRLELLRADTERRFCCCVVVLAKGRAVGSLQRVFAAATSGDVSLPERERNHKARQEQKQVKRASNEMRFGCGANVRFHLAYASMRKHLLLQACQSRRDSSCKNSTNLRNRLVFVRLDHVVSIIVNADHGVM